MLKLNNNDVKILKENFDEDSIKKLDAENVNKIYNYLENEGIDFAKDIFLYYMNLFLYSFEKFTELFEKFKKNCSGNYIELLANDLTLLSEME